jgi:hypothetical protein
LLVVSCQLENGHERATDPDEASGSSSFEAVEVMQ